MSLTSRIRLVRDYFGENGGSRLYPQTIQFVVTNRCNLSCPMCPHSLMTRDQGVMDLDFYKRIIDEIRGKTELVYLHGMGEPLLVKNYDEYIRYAVRNDLYTVLSSNVTVFNPRNVKKLIASGLDFLTLSVDATTEDTYRKVRGGKSLEHVIESCKAIAREKIATGAKLKIFVQCIVMEENKNEI